VIGNNSVGVLDDDLKLAGLKALTISRASCRAFALTQSWERSARQFISNCRPCLRSRADVAGDNKPLAVPGSPPDEDRFEAGSITRHRHSN
jgi:hypothetical protein